MRWDNLLLICLFGLAGCAPHRPDGWSQTASTGATSKSSAVIVTPTQTRTGKVASVNPTARYVVITYSVGVPLPAVERRLNVYRAGLKVAEVKVSKEQIDVNTVADIVAGECQVGDEVRED